MYNVVLLRSWLYDRLQVLYSILYVQVYSTFDRLPGILITPPRHALTLSDECVPITAQTVQYHDGLLQIALLTRYVGRRTDCLKFLMKLPQPKVSMSVWTWMPRR